MAKFPEEDVKRFYEATLTAINDAMTKKSPFSSIKEAANVAYVNLKTSPEGWAYGPHTINLFPKQFNSDQLSGLNIRFANISTLPASGSHSPVAVLKREMLENEDIRTKFISDAAAGSSRARLAFTYGYPLDQIGFILTEFIMREGLKNSYYNVNGDRSRPYYLRKKLDAVVRKNQRWASLSNFEVMPENSTFHPPGKWPLIPTLDEHDELTALKNDLRRTEEKSHPQETAIRGSLSGDALPGELVPDRHGTPLSKNWASQQNLRKTAARKMSADTKREH